MSQHSGQVGVVIVGAGHWGPHLIRNFTDALNSHVIGVVESDARRRREIQLRYPNIRVTDNRSIVSEPGVDAVAIASPSETHYELGRFCLEAGKHVLVEKPLATSQNDADELCRLADRSDLVLMVGHVFLFNPGVNALKLAIDDGTLGDVQLVTMQRTNLGPIRTDVNAAWDLASHDISIADHLLGSPPQTVSAVAASWLNSHIEDAAFITLSYPGNVLTHIEVSWLHPRKTREIAVVGSNRMATFDDMNLNEPFRIYDKGVDNDAASAGVTDTFGGFRASIREGEVRIPRVRLGEPLKSECDAFLQRILGDANNLSDGWSGLRVVATLEACMRSIEYGGAPVEVETV